MSRNIKVYDKRKIYAESMGKCMNPECKADLFTEGGDMMEKAHITPYSETHNNSHKNLIILCPNCHTNFDKNNAFSIDDVRTWKEIRKEEFERFFSIKYETFKELESKVIPLLEENKMIFEEYYLGEERNLWDLFERKILSNNRQLKSILENNTKLIQNNSDDKYSNLVIIQNFMFHINEFEATRLSQEKVRRVLFPAEINSLFGIEPLKENFIPSVESIECLVEELKKNGEFESIVLGIDSPYIQIKRNDTSQKIYLNDSPRLRQLYYNYNCFRKTGVRFKSLNFALKAIKSRGLKFSFLNMNNLKEITVKGIKIVFVYEYCLSRMKLYQMAPEEESVVLNLHNWNHKSCISTEAYESAKEMNVKLLRMDEFYAYINSIKYKI